MTKAADKAYKTIGKLILNGHFKPGDHLSEEDLSEASGVSRTPVRDALRRLENEYFVVIRPNHGAQVAVWNAHDIEDLFEMRARLEGMAAARAAERRDASDLQKLAKCVEKIDVVINSDERPDVSQFLEYNRRFHHAVFDAARSPRLKAINLNLVAPAVVARTAEFFTHADLIRSNAHHRDLSDAIAAGEAQLSETIMRTHILAAAHSYKKFAK